MQADIRRSARRALPAEVFQPRPLRALLIPLWLVAAIGVGSVIALAGLPWWADLGLALALGQLYAMLAFSAHEILHGSTVRGRLAQRVLGGIGFLPFLVSPHLWNEWHNRRHHTHANQGHRDPDSFGGIEHFEPGGARRAVMPLLPGSGHPLSYLFLFYWFTWHNLFILLFVSSRFRGYDRRPALVYTAFAAVFWAAVIALTGWAAIFVVAIPMLIGNALVMSYITTNHMMRPERPAEDILGNTMSVKVPWLVDVLHGWFSHHVEHHLFPTMSPSQAPRLRAWLRRNAPEDYLAPRLTKALWWLYRTPRPHDGPDVLALPGRPDRRVALERLTQELRDDRWVRLAPGAETRSTPARSERSVALS